MVSYTPAHRQVFFSSAEMACRVAEVTAERRVFASFHSSGVLGSIGGCLNWCAAIGEMVFMAAVGGMVFMAAVGETVFMLGRAGPGVVEAG